MSQQNRVLAPCPLHASSGDGTLSRNERRTEKRFRTITRIPVAFYNKGKLFEGIIHNLSENGACLKFVSDNTCTMPLFSKGKTMECYVSTQVGASKFRGRIQWHTTIDDSTLKWGLNFLELPKNSEDPFNIALCDICHTESSLPLN